MAVSSIYLQPYYLSCDKPLIKNFLKENMPDFRYLILIILSTANIVHAKNKPSFDCELAQSKSEKTICASENLSALDVKLTQAYKEFRSFLPKESGALARKLQINWIRSREKRCIENGYPDYFGYETKVNDYNPYASENIEECLTEYYHFALSAFSKGVLISSVFINPSDTDLRLGFPNIDRVNVVYETIEQRNCLDSEGNPAGAFEKTRYELISNGKTYLLGNGQIDICGISGYEERVAELRLYLTNKGSFLPAIRLVRNNAGGRCGFDHSSALQFLDIPVKGDRVVFYSGDSSSEINLLTQTYACGATSDSTEGWSLENGKLNFNYLNDPSWYYWIKFASVYSVRVDPRTNSYVRRAPSEFSERNLSSSELTTLIAKLKKDSDNITLKGVKLPSECAAVYKGIRNYIELKKFASNNRVSQKHAFYLVSKAKDMFSIAEREETLEVTLRTFLLYLEKMQKIENWENVLKDFSQKYQRPNHHYFMLDHTWKNNPLVVAGFYSEASCLAVQAAPTGALTIEDWIYLFWARRLMDGSLKQTETMIRSVLNF